MELRYKMQRKVVKMSLKFRLKIFNVVGNRGFNGECFCCCCCRSFCSCYCCWYSSCMPSIISCISYIRTDTNTITATSNGRQTREALSAVPATDIDSSLWALNQLIGSWAPPAVLWGWSHVEGAKLAADPLSAHGPFFSDPNQTGIDERSRRSTAHLQNHVTPSASLCATCRHIAHCLNWPVMAATSIFIQF